MEEKNIFIYIYIFTNNSYIFDGIFFKQIKLLQNVLYDSKFLG